MTYPDEIPAAGSLPRPGSDTQMDDPGLDGPAVIDGIQSQIEGIATSLGPAKGSFDDIDERLTDIESRLAAVGGLLTLAGLTDVYSEFVPPPTRGSLLLADGAGGYVHVPPAAWKNGTALAAAVGTWITSGSGGRTAPQIATTTLPSAVQGSVYVGGQLTLVAGTGALPGTWAVVSGFGTGGSAPATPIAGLTLNQSTGAITGTATQNGALSIVFSYTDIFGQATTRTLGLVVAATSAFAFTMPTIPDAVVGVDYVFDLAPYVTGGTKFGGAETAGHQATAHYHFTSSSLPNKKIRLDADGSVTGTAGRLYSQTLAYGGVANPPTAADVVTGMTVQATAYDTTTSVARSGTMNVVPAVGGFDIAPYIGESTYVIGGGPVDPVANVAAINAAAAVQGMNGRIYNSGAPGPIMVGGTTAAQTLINTNVNTWDIAGCEWTLAATQPVGPSGTGAGGVIFYLHDADAPYLRFDVNGRAAQQTTSVPGVNDGGYYCTGIKTYKCGPVNEDVTIRNCRGVVGGTRGNTTLTGATAALSGTITYGAHGLVVGGTVKFTNRGGLTNVNLTTAYYVKATPTADTLTLSTSSGGALLTFTGTAGAVTLTAFNGAQEVFDQLNLRGAGGDVGTVVCDTTDGTGHQTAFDLPDPSSTCTANPATDTITAAKHGAIVGQRIRFVTLGTITGVTVGTDYYVNTVPTDDTFTLTATIESGVVLNLTGVSSAVTMHAYAGPGYGASGAVWQYIGLGVDGRATATTDVAVNGNGRRHLTGCYCGGNIAYREGSGGRGCHTVFNIEAGDPSGSSNPNAQTTGDVTIGSPSGATNGQIITARSDIAVNTNGNNRDGAGGTVQYLHAQIKSVKVYGHDSHRDATVYYQTGGALAALPSTPSDYQLNNGRAYSPTVIVLDHASSGTNLAQEQTATTIVSSDVHNDQGATIVDSYGATTGTFGSF